MSSWLGGIISKLSPRKSVSLTNLSEDGADGNTVVVENIEPDHRTTDYLETRERITRPAKIKRRRNTSKPQPDPEASTSCSPAVKKRSSVLSREKSPARRFLAAGLDMLTRNITVSSPDASDSESLHAEHIGAPEDEVEKCVVDSVDAAKKRLFEELPVGEDMDVNTEASVVSPASQTDDVTIPEVTDEVCLSKRSSTDQQITTRETRPRQVKAARSKSCQSPKRKLFPFHFEIQKRKRGPDFTVHEERQMVEYFKRHGGFGTRGGNSVWKRMEEAGVCRPRTWQSLKQRFQMYVSHDLAHFGVTELELLASAQQTPPSEDVQSKESILDDLETSDELFEDASEDPPSPPDPAPRTPERMPSSQAGAAVPGTPVYECQLLADRQAELLKEIRELGAGASVAGLSLPGTPTKQVEKAPPNAAPKQAAPVGKSSKCSLTPKVLPAPCPEKEIPAAVWKVKRRSPYCRAEEQEIINYFLRHGGFLSRGGNAVWRQMEASAGTCPGRTWQSLKERFNKFTLPNLHMFGVKRRDLIEGGGSAGRPVEARLPVEKGDPDPPPRRRRRGPPYSRAEEGAIVRFFLTRGGYAQRRGNMVWKKMEAARICPGRTWQSLKQRFDSFVQNNLDQFDVTEGGLMGVTDLIKKTNEQETNKDGEPEAEKDPEPQKASTPVTPRPRAGLGRSKYRQPYSAGEEAEMVAHLAREGGYASRGGNKVWQGMEEAGVAKGRTWQSLKARFFKAVQGRLGEFGTSEEELSAAQGSNGEKSCTSTNSDEPDHDTESTQVEKQIYSIFGPEKPLDIDVGEVEDEANHPAAHFNVEHNDGEPSELDLLSIEVNSDSLKNRIMARRSSDGNGRGKKKHTDSIDIGTSIKEMLNIDGMKKRKALTQDLPESPPKKKMRYELPSLT